MPPSTPANASSSPSWLQQPAGADEKEHVALMLSVQQLMDEMQARARLAEHTMAAVVADNRALTDHCALGDAAFMHLEAEIARRLEEAAEEANASSRQAAAALAEATKEAMERKDERIRALECELALLRKGAAEKADAEKAAAERAAVAAEPASALSEAQWQWHTVTMQKQLDTKRIVEVAGGHNATSSEIGVSLTWDSYCDLALQ